MLYEVITIFGNAALEMGDADERYARLVDGVFEGWIARLREVLAAAQQAGEVRRDLDAESLARHLVAATEGGIMLARLKKSRITSYNVCYTKLLRSPLFDAPQGLYCVGVEGLIGRVHRIARNTLRVSKQVRSG